MDKERRLFGKDDKTLLYVMAEGRCQQCGEPLNNSFHADHRTPFSQGGQTDIANGQALCPKCNLIKGGKGMLPEWGATLREWQEDAFQRFQAQATSKRDYLLVATPGSGKTRVALRIAHWLFQQGQIQRLIVVTPTSHLRRQWSQEAHKLAGIELEPEWKGPSENAAMDGMAITYQLVAMGSNDKLQRLLVSRKKTLVILDEIHHAGEQRTWGDAIRQAYELAEYRLLLSGTPFRSDNFPIAFVNYDAETGICKPDCIYGYGTALQDDVCRDVLFPSYNARIKYMLNGGVVNVTFDDTVDETGGSNRLRMALSPKGDWMKEVLVDANRELLRVREGQPNGAGLIITIDQRHAYEVATLLETVTGQAPVVAVSDDPNASDNIEAFRKGKEPWLVAVRMVSEGVDIPRLRVGVYATNVTSELFFRQAVGRFVRMEKDYEDQTAYMFIPEDPRLVEFAKQIKVECQHGIEELEELEFERNEREQGELTKTDLTLIEAIPEEGTTVFDSDAFSPQELERARAIASQAGLVLGQRFDAVAVAKVARILSPLEAAQQKRMANDQPLYERLKRLRRMVNKRVNELAYVTQKTPKEVHAECKWVYGMWLPECNESECLARIQYLKEQINIARSKQNGGQS